jgi:hypothetical protein
MVFATCQNYLQIPNSFRTKRVEQFIKFMQVGVSLINEENTNLSILRKCLGDVNPFAWSKRKIPLVFPANESFPLKLQ